tara:strand:+ start:711 stop:1397 length:687 start_codon:yes stop_codon:yes gene_type:complete
MIDNTTDIPDGMTKYMCIVPADLKAGDLFNIEYVKGDNVTNATVKVPKGALPGTVLYFFAPTPVSMISDNLSVLADAAVEVENNTSVKVPDNNNVIDEKCADVVVVEDPLMKMVTRMKKVKTIAEEYMLKMSKKLEKEKHIAEKHVKIVEERLIKMITNMEKVKANAEAYILKTTKKLEKDKLVAEKQLTVAEECLLKMINKMEMLVYKMLSEERRLKMKSWRRTKCV